MSDEIELHGLEQVFRRLEDLGRDLQIESAGTLYELMSEVITDSQENYVPVDVGTLKNSGHVEEPEVHGDEISVRGGFGGQARDYAVEQHENLHFHHTVGGPKYLEKPLATMEHDFQRKFVERVKRRTGL